MEKSNLTLIVGPMWAGKTTKMLDLIKDNIFKGNKVRVFRPSNDTRYSLNHLVNHDGLSYPAETLNVDEPIFPTDLKSPTVIFLDEVHFYPIRLVNRIETLIEKGHSFVCSGIFIDTRGRTFSTTGKLIEMAKGNFYQMTAPCEVCNNPVYFTKRRPGAPEGDVGGSERYMNRCKGCEV
jgi:thymidine kinase